MQCPAIACKARPWQPPNEARDELTRAGSYRWRRWRKGCNVQQTQSENVPWLAAPNVNGHHCMWRGGYSGGGDEYHGGEHHHNPEVATADFPEAADEFDFVEELDGLGVEYESQDPLSHPLLDSAYDSSPLLGGPFASDPPMVDLLAAGSAAAAHSASARWCGACRPPRQRLVGRRGKIQRSPGAPVLSRGG